MRLSNHFVMNVSDLIDIFARVEKARAATEYKPALKNIKVDIKGDEIIVTAMSGYFLSTARAKVIDPECDCTFCIPYVKLPRPSYKNTQAIVELEDNKLIVSYDYHSYNIPVSADDEGFVSKDTAFPKTAIAHTYIAAKYLKKALAAMGNDDIVEIQLTGELTPQVMRSKNAYALLLPLNVKEDVKEELWNGMD